MNFSSIGKEPRRVKLLACSKVRGFPSLIRIISSNRGRSYYSRHFLNFKSIDVIKVEIVFFFQVSNLCLMKDSDRLNLLKEVAGNHIRKHLVAIVMMMYTLPHLYDALRHCRLRRKKSRIT
jgi:hypothetical protein